MGLVLETFHGIKAGFYLDVGNETRRLMWTLSHTHGTLLGLVHVAFSFTLTRIRRGDDLGTAIRLASRILVLAGFLLPGGFLLSGFVVHSGDPGIAVLLVPAGGLAFVAAAVATSVAVLRTRLD